MGSGAELVAAMAVVEGIEKAYSSYQKLGKLLGATERTTDDEILDELRSMRSQVDLIKNKLDQLGNVLQQVLDQQRKDELHLTLQNIQATYAESRTGGVELLQWKEDGGTDSVLRDQAYDHILSAADRMRDTPTFFQRPNPKSGPPDFLFDHRLATPTYLYTLTSYVGSLRVLHPHFRTVVAIQDNLRLHLQWLEQLCTEADQLIKGFTAGRYDAKTGNIMWQGDAHDELSGLPAMSAEIPRTAWVPGTQAYVDDRVREVGQTVHWWVQLNTGLAALMAYRDAFRDNVRDPWNERWTPWFQVVLLDPVQKAPPVPDYEIRFGGIRAVSPQEGASEIFWVDEGGLNIWSARHDPSGGKAPEWIGPIPTAKAPDYSHPLDLTAAVSPSEKSVSVFYNEWFNGFASVYKDDTTKGQWSPRYLLPVQVAGNEAAAVSWAPDSIAVFFRSAGDEVSATWYQGMSGQPTWSAPVALTAAGAMNTKSTPQHSLCAASPEPGQVDVFWVNNDYGINYVHGDLNAGTWTAPVSLAETDTVDWTALDTLTALSPAPGMTCVYWAHHYDDRQRAIRSLIVEQGSLKNPPHFVTDMDQPVFEGEVAAASAGRNQVRLFYARADGQIWSTATTEPLAETWSAPDRRSYPLTTQYTPAALSNRSGAFEIFHHEDDGLLIVSSYDPENQP